MPQLLKGLTKGLITLAIAVAAVGAVYVSYQYKPAVKQAQNRRPGADFPVPVTFGMAKRTSVPVYFDGVGTAKALNTVIVKPQVDGKIMTLAFKEGQDVKKGDLITKIDPTSYQAALEQAQAKRALTEATLANAKRDLERYANVSALAVAVKTLDTQKALVLQTQAQLKADDAAIAAAKAFVDWTNVTAPIAGRTGLRLVDEGNLVRAGDAGIVTISQLQPIAVLFTLPQQQLAQVNRSLAQGTLAVEAVEGDTKTVLDRGSLSVVDNQVDQSTGTVRLKAEMPNGTMQLWPGQFVNVRLLVETLKDVVVIPSQALQRGPTGAFVYVVGTGDTVSVRPVTLGLQAELQTVVTKGIEADERVVTAGFGRLKEGAKVQAAPQGDGAAPANGDSGAPTPGPSAAVKGKGGGGGGAGVGANDVRTACRTDMEKLCPGVEREGRRACMDANKEKLSDGCKGALRAASGGAAVTPAAGTRP